MIYRFLLGMESYYNVNFRRKTCDRVIYLFASCFHHHLSSSINHLIIFLLYSYDLDWVFLLSSPVSSSWWRVLCDRFYCEAHMWRILFWGSYVKDLIVRPICEESYCGAWMCRVLLWGPYVKDPFVRLICEGFYCEGHMWRIL